MYYLLLTLLVLDAILLITVVLLQAGKGGGLAAMGAAGSDSLFGTRHATTLLTKATWWTGGIFLVLSFTLSLLSGRTTQPSSILREGLQAPAAVTPGLPGGTAPLTPGVTESAPTTADPAAPAAGAETPPVTPAPEGQ